jgi:hypothetical protein
MSDQPAARRFYAVGWWMAAALAIVTVGIALFLLSGAQPSAAQLQAAHNQSLAEEQTDDAAFGSQLAAAHAAKFAQEAAVSQARATETKAQAGAVSADATARDASATAPAP